MQKKDVLALLEHYPEGEIDPEELIRELYLNVKLEHAEGEVDRGETISHDEVVRQSQQWFQPT
jgi:hypothetical protein